MRRLTSTWNSFPSDELVHEVAEFSRCGAPAPAQRRPRSRPPPSQRSAHRRGPISAPRSDQQVANPANQTEAGETPAAEAELSRLYDKRDRDLRRGRSSAVGQSAQAGARSAPLAFRCIRVRPFNGSRSRAAPAIQQVYLAVAGVRVEEFRWVGQPPQNTPWVP